MCERYSIAAAVRLIGVFAIVFAGVVSSYAQGGDGRSDSVRLPASEDDDRRPGKASKRPPLRSAQDSSPKVELPQTGRVAINVNGGGSVLQLFREGLPTPEETISVPDRASSLIVRTLEVGSYRIAVKKPGFHDEVRTLEIDKGERRRVEINLRPKSATLSVASNLPDAKITIDNLGVFERPVVKALVKPGLYRVSVSRRGYVSRQMEVRLKTAGAEEKLNVILEPLRIDTVLSLAENNIGSMKLTEAEELVRDVLALNPEHAHANVLYGLLELDRGNAKASVDRLLKGIRGGDTLTLPVNVVDTGTSSVVPVELMVDRNSIRFRSADTPGLNFSIARGDLQVSRTFNSADRAPFVIVWGKSNFYGREIEPQLRIFSNLSAVDGSSADCSQSQAGRSCRSDIEILQRLITEWRD